LVGQRLWLAALALALVGLASLVGIDGPSPLRLALYVLPYAAAIGLTAWGGRRRPLGAVAGLAGIGVMTAVSWLEAVAREGPGFEWRFNNAMQFACACGTNYLVLAATAIGTLAGVGPALKVSSAGEEPVGVARVGAEPAAAADGGHDAGSL
jgi:hypothetical protein